VRVIGRGGHAAQPHATIDPIPVACAIVGQLQLLVSRQLDPLDSAVLTIGKIEGGTVENIIPDEAAIYGTCRTLSPQTLEQLVAGIERVASHVAAAHGASARVIIKPGYPCTINHAREARFMGEVAELVGAQQAHTEVLPAMTAEDFGFMLEQCRRLRLDRQRRAGQAGQPACRALRLQRRHPGPGRHLLGPAGPPVVCPRPGRLNGRPARQSPAPRRGLKRGATSC
jgi:amidohydrolase